jgi:hypothetical protein
MPATPNANGGRHRCRPPLSTVATLLPKLGVPPGIGFRPRPCGPGRFPFGFPSEAEAPSRFPGRSTEASFDGTLSGSPTERTLPVSREPDVEPKSGACLFPVPAEANFFGSRSGPPAKRTSPALLSRIHRPKARVPLDASSGKWGRHLSEDFSLALLPWGARPELSRRSRRSVAAAFGRCRNLVSPFPEEPPCRLPHRYAAANRFAPPDSACG